MDASCRSCAWSWETSCDLSAWVGDSKKSSSLLNSSIHPYRIGVNGLSLEWVNVRSFFNVDFIKLVDRTLSLLAVDSQIRISILKRFRWIRTLTTSDWYLSVGFMHLTAASKTSSSRGVMMRWCLCRGTCSSDLLILFLFQYLYLVLKDQCTLPKEGLWMIRYHSFYP